MVHHFLGVLDWLESVPAFQKCFETRDVVHGIGPLHSGQVWDAGNLKNLYKENNLQ